MASRHSRQNRAASDSRTSSVNQRTRPSCLIEALEARQLLSAQIGPMDDALLAPEPRQAAVELADPAATDAIEVITSLETSATTVMSGENVTLTATVTPKDPQAPLPAAKVVFLKLDEHGALRYTDPDTGSISLCWLLGTADLDAQGKATLTIAASGPERILVQGDSRTLVNPTALTTGPSSIIAIVQGESATLDYSTGNTGDALPPTQPGLRTSISNTASLLVRTAASMQTSTNRPTLVLPPMFTAAFVYDDVLCGLAWPHLDDPAAIQSATAKLGAIIPLPPPPTTGASGSFGSAGYSSGGILTVGSNWGSGGILDIPHSGPARLEYVGLIPSGAIHLYDGDTLLGSTWLDTNGTVAFTSTSSLSLGLHTLKIVYDGNDFFAGATVSYTVSVEPIGTSLSLSTSTYAVPQGRSVDWTATVSTLTPDYAVPTGTVTFMEGNTVLATIRLGETVYDLTLDLGLGTHSITAVYSGDDNCRPSTSAPMTQVIIAAPQDPAPTTPTPWPIFMPHPIGIPFKTVYLHLPAGVVLQQSGAATQTHGATFIAKLTRSDGTFFSSNANSSPDSPLDSPGTPAMLRFRMGPGRMPQQPIRFPTSTPPVLQSSPLFISGSQPMPTGTVKFYNGSQLIGAAPVDADGTATLPSVQLPPGQNAIRAVYEGNSDYAPAESTALPVNVGRATTLTDLSFKQSPRNRTLAMNLAVRTSKADTAVPRGFVTLWDGHKKLGRYRLGSASAPILLNLKRGVHHLRAVYSGDANCAASASSLIRLVIDRSNTPIQQ